MKTTSFVVVSWGLQRGASKKAFRPAMALSTGELRGLSGKLLLMTATASRKTIRILQDQFPEITKWKLLLNLPLRDNVTIVIPPPETIVNDEERLLAPFIWRMQTHDEFYLVLVRGEIKVIVTQTVRERFKATFKLITAPDFSS